MSLSDQRSVAVWTMVGAVCAVITVVISLVQVTRNDAPEPGPAGAGVTVLEPQSPSPSPGLDVGLDATYFTEDGVAGFPGDPLGFPMTSGGPVDVSGVGGGCVGYAARAPDFQFTWDGGGGLLRFFFVGDGDTALVVNAPDASWYCNDDSHGGLNPTVDFAAAADGTYDVWVASVSSGASVGGTLFVSELESQVPQS
jgi:serine protease Do